jgi:hypothetical protein
MTRGVPLAAEPDHLPPLDPPTLSDPLCFEPMTSQEDSGLGFGTLGISYSPAGPPPVADSIGARVRARRAVQTSVGVVLAAECAVVPELSDCSARGEFIRFGVERSDATSAGSTGATAPHADDDLICMV